MTVEQDPIAWQDGFVLGYGPMDRTHEEFVELLGQLQSAPDAQLPALLDEFLAHTERHFEEEDRWMQETAFPPRDCHIEEHGKVLASVREVRALLAQRRVALCRSLAQALAEWFPGHATHLDSALAHWMFKRDHGGKPVVIRRVIPEGAGVPPQSDRATGSARGA